MLDVKTVQDLLHFVSRKKIPPIQELIIFFGKEEKIATEIEIKARPKASLGGILSESTGNENRKELLRFLNGAFDGVFSPPKQNNQFINSLIIL